MADGNIAWSVDIGDSSNDVVPCVLSDRSIAIVTDGGTAVRVDENGNEVASKNFSFGGELQHGIIPDDEDHLYFNGGGTFYRVDKDFNVDWSISLDGGSNGAPAYHSETNQVFHHTGGGTLYAIDRDTGSINWSDSPTGGDNFTCPQGINADGFVWGGQAGTVFMYEPDGTKRWSRSPGGTIEAAGYGYANGDILQHTDNGFFRYNRNGDLVASNSNINNNSRTALNATRDEEIVFANGSSGGDIWKLDADLNEIWRTQNVLGEINNGILIDDEDSAYANGRNGVQAFKKFDVDGKQVYSTPTGDTDDNPPAADGRVGQYYQFCGSVLYAIENSVPPLRGFDSSVSFPWYYMAARSRGITFQTSDQALLLKEGLGLRGGGVSTGDQVLLHADDVARVDKNVSAGELAAVLQDGDIGQG